MERPEATCTVVIPCFNGEATLEQAFQSVMNQSFREFHLVLVDDDSQDDTLRLASRLAQDRANVSVVSLGENKGQSHARNRGVAETAGPYVAFLDQDDSYHPEFLAHAMEVFAAHPDVDAVKMQPTLSVEVHPAQYKMIAGSIATTQVSRRRAFLFAGGWPESQIFREHPGSGEDIAFNSVFTMLFRVANSSRQLYHYNHRPGNALDLFLSRTHVVDNAVQFHTVVDSDEALRQEIEHFKQQLSDRIRRLIYDRFIDVV